MRIRESRIVNEESGIALIVTVLLLLLVSAIGVSALNRAGDERLIESASRRRISNLMAAEAGMEIVRQKLEGISSNQAVLTQIALDEPALFTDPVSGTTTAVRTGVIGDPTIESVSALGPAPTQGGDEISEGKNSASARRMVYRVNVTASDSSGANAQIQAQFSVRVNSGGY